MSLATFEPNPNSENEPWIERPAWQDAKFRIWHLMFFCSCAFGILIVLICCCVRIRVPRTKQEIEADYKRKKIATKFRKRLKIIRNQDMEGIDLQKALEIIIEADFKSHQKEDAAGFNPAENEKEQLIPTTTAFQRGNFRKGVANVIQIGKMTVSNKTANA